MHPTHPALEGNKVIATHGPAEKGQKAHGGAWRWEDAEMSTTSKTLRVHVQALSWAENVPRTGSASKIPGQDLAQPKLSQVSWEDGSAMRDLPEWVQSATLGVDQSRTRGRAQGRSVCPRCQQRNPNLRHQPLQTGLSSSCAPAAADALGTSSGPLGRAEMRCPGMCSSLGDFPRYPVAEPWPREGIMGLLQISTRGRIDA